MMLEPAQVVTEFLGNLEHLFHGVVAENGTAPAVENLVYGRNIQPDLPGNLALGNHLISFSGFHHPIFRSPRHLGVGLYGLTDIMSRAKMNKMRFVEVWKVEGYGVIFLFQWQRRKRKKRNQA